MILEPSWLLANRHILLAIGGLQEIQIQHQRELGHKWSFAISSIQVIALVCGRLATNSKKNI